MSTQDKQIALAQELQLAWLEDMVRQYKEGTITSTDRATLARVLMMNGWSLDPTRLSQNLKDKILDRVAFDDEIEDGIIPIRREA